MNLDRRDFLGVGAALALARVLPPAAMPPHAALHLYTAARRVRSRHAAVVEAALVKRAAAHTSGWERRDTKPVLAVGPVKNNAAHFHGEAMVKEVARAWPLVAVLEYDGVGKPEAFVDWFRRARGATAPDGWLLDPAVGYSEHINAEVVHRDDERWAYMAVADTPTGDVISAMEFVVRMRVRWQNGATALAGWWFWFDAPKSKNANDWRCVATPLCDWLVAKAEKEAGVLASAPIADRERELAVWGTDTVFRFPVMPGGLDAGRGRG